MKRKVSFLFFTPAVLLYFVFVIFPIFFGFYISLSDINGITSSFKFTGFDNYGTIFSDNRFWNSIKVTTIFTLLTAVAQNVFSLLFAFLLEIQIKKWQKNVIRVFLFLPTVMTPLIVGYIWYYIYKIGLPSIFSTLGLKSLSNFIWLGEDFTLYSVVISTVWLHMGTSLIIYIASLTGIDEEIRKASSIDGATGLKRIIYVDLPLMIPALLINTVLSVIDGFKQFDQIYSMTKGGPGTATETMSLLIYQKAFFSNQAGYGAAASYVLFFIVMILAVIIVTLFRTREVEA